MSTSKNPYVQALFGEYTAILEFKLLAAELGKSRQVGWQPAILESRLLAAELGKSR